MADAKQKRLRAAICLLLASVTVVLYWPITHHAFINFDDQQYISDNPHVTAGLTWSGIVWAFRSGYACNWHPLTWISHMIDCSLYGLNPGGHHLTNLFIHSANVVLLFLLLDRMTRAIWRSAFVSALFAWHPLHVESVAWAAERKDVLCAFFWILTMMAYVRYVEETNSSKIADEAQYSRRGTLYGLTLVLFALGLMSKPMMVTLPFVLLLVDFWPLGRIKWSGVNNTDKFFNSGGHRVASAGLENKQLIALAVRLVREKVPFFVLTIAASIVTYLVQKTGGAVWAAGSLPLPVRIFNALLAYMRYISKTIWPANLAVIYPYHDFWSLGLLIGTALLFGVWSFLLFWWGRWRPYLIVGWLWYLGTLVPTIGLVQVGSQTMADRYMYIPSIGLFILIVWGVNELLSSKPWKSMFLAWAGTAMLAGCLVCTRLQLRYWQNSATLFLHAVQVTTGNYSAYNGLGKALDDMGKKEEALRFYAEAIRIEPHFPEAQYNLGSVLMGQGRLDEAISHFKLALQDDPKLAQAHNNWAKALLKEQKPDEAEVHLARAVALQPDDPEAHYNLGTLFLMQSKTDKAIAEFIEALRLKPDYAQAHHNLAVALMSEGKAREGTLHFMEQVRLDPTDPDARFNLGLAFQDQNRLNDAAAQFSEAVRLKPGDPQYQYRLATVLARQRKSKQAVFHFREALRLRIDFPEALNGLAWILATDPDPQLRAGGEAIERAERACELTKHEQPAEMMTLAAAYAEKGQFTEAINAAQKARDLALAADQTEIAARAGEFLKLFEAGQPFRQ